MAGGETPRHRFAGDSRRFTEPRSRFLSPDHSADPVTTDRTRIFMARIRRHRRDTVQSPLETYLREINEMALLTADEEKMLAHRIAEGDNSARDRMVRANLRLVVNIARGYVGKGLALQDLIEEGNLGLLRAVEGFDPGVGTRFSTYASYWIKQSIKRALVNTAKPIRIPGLHGRAASSSGGGRPPTFRTSSAGPRPSRRSPACWGCPRRSWRSSRRRSRSTTSSPRPISPRTAGASAKCSWTSAPAPRTSRWSRPTTSGSSCTGSTRWTSARPPSSGCGSGSTTRPPRPSRKSASGSD